ncbi:MAG: TetR family transcriptional regulator [Propionibacteriaceae bacterium]|nr:TetR family transcriptional regulator [Propionibacteriaceae bacterium]
MPDRRTQIAEAGVRILASQGVRALTHRAIDSELGLPAGSTSYYARSRRDLIGLIVDLLAGRTEREIIAPRLPTTITPAVVADLLVAAMDAASEHSDEQRARLLLLLEFHGDPDLRDRLTTRPAVHGAYVATASAVLELLDVANPDTHARDLVGLLDSLSMQRVHQTAGLDERGVLTAYLDGLPRVESEPSRPGISPAAAARGLLSRFRGPRSPHGEAPA